MESSIRLDGAGVEKVGLVSKLPEERLMDVTDVLRDRRGEPDGLQKMLVGLRRGAHGGRGAGDGRATLGRPPAEPPRTVMTISIAAAAPGRSAAG